MSKSMSKSVSKKSHLNPTLVIVESPAKCKKIEEYLGAGYKCVASYGHLRTLSSLANIDIEHGFTPTYTIIDGSAKKKQIELLQKEIKDAYEVILSSDNDREGEMIAYSIIELFHLPLDTKRITFNEITKSAIQYAMQHPRTIDMKIVHAQQARQILDLLVGFKISPVLWKLVKQNKETGLSAGRCQTPALKLVYENQKEIDQATERIAYNTTGYFTNANLPFHLNKQIDDESAMMHFLDKSAHFTHTYSCSLPVQIRKHPPEPLTTSRLQQTASNELRYSPKETMNLCQRLYEGGYITYMRTDSTSYCTEFIDTVNVYISHTYNDAHIKQTHKRRPKKTDYAQEAHEAIRPTNISLQYLPETMSVKEKKLYKLIWTTALESCMADATAFAITATIAAPDALQYSYTTELIEFPGWKIVENKFPRENKEYYYLQSISANCPMNVKKICSTVTIAGAKAHYTEAKLVQLLEEKGIGRPSTFSSLIDKIQERGYVSKMDVRGKERACNEFELEDGVVRTVVAKREFGNEKNKLIIQPLGVMVMDLLNDHFNSLFRYEYTSLMESSLDEISKGCANWVDLCKACNEEVDQLIERVRHESKIEFQIDPNNTLLIGKYGPVIKCTNGTKDVSFKSVKKDIDMSKLKNGELSVDDIMETRTHHLVGTYGGHDVVVKHGKYGLYVSWGEHSKTLKELQNKAMHEITLEDVIPILEKGSNVVREINVNMSIRKGPKGDYLFYKTMKMKKPLFYDIKGFCEEYATCDIDILTLWIRDTYKLAI